MTPERQITALTENQRERNGSIVLLFLLFSTNDTNYTIFPEGDEICLKRLFEQLLNEDLVTLNGAKYEITTKGRQLVDTLRKRQQEFNFLYQMFRYVDTEVGEFGYAKLHDYDSDQMDAHLDNSRWLDLRLMVADFKGLNIMEVVFTMMLTNGEFDTTSKGWEFKLISPETWNGMTELATNYYRWQEFGETEDEARENVEFIISSGNELKLELMTKEREIKEENARLRAEAEANNTEVEYVTYERVYEDDYDDDYYQDRRWQDPYYRSDSFSDTLMTAIILDEILD